MDLKLKLNHQKETRRITLNQCTFFSLKQKIEQLFNIQNYNIKYEDEEGDLITIDSEEEMVECARLKEGQVVSLKISSSTDNEDQNQPRCNFRNFFCNRKREWSMKRFGENMSFRRKIFLAVVFFFFISKILKGFLFLLPLLLIVLVAKFFLKEVKFCWDKIVYLAKQDHLGYRNRYQYNFEQPMNPNYFPNQPPNNVNLQNHVPSQPNIQSNFFEDKLKELEVMGFSNRESNLVLLQRFNGDVAQVINDILSK
eukprot:TRINITY_DN14239_c0_g1_i1.p1 TRINITY_DN14239_c0_g1~~TRINITY_DN14239_c0_g1_i1.p1  ORF type:complete len:262 (+),score=81.16 TRINITY_DN14239_c0_g1_i1:27-788(+)